MHVRRLGEITSLFITFASAKFSHVFVGYIRYTVGLYVDIPVLWYRSGSFANVSVACGCDVRCTKCSGQHDHAEYPAAPIVGNILNSEATSKDPAKW